MTHRWIPRLWLAFAAAALFLVMGGFGRLSAEDWARVSSKDNKISALFPIDLSQVVETKTDKTLAGKVTSYFGEYQTEGLLLAASGADIPGLARLAGAERILSETKKTFLEEAQGKETRFEPISVAGAKAASELLYEGKAYRGQGAPYTGRALLILVNRRVYIVNAVFTEESESNRAAAQKMFDSIEVRP